MPRDAGNEPPVGWPLLGPACHGCPVRKAHEDSGGPSLHVEARSVRHRCSPLLRLAKGSRAASLFALSRPVPLLGSSPQSERPRGLAPIAADSGTPPFQRRRSGRTHFLARLPTGGEVGSCGGRQSIRRLRRFAQIRGRKTEGGATESTEITERPQRGASWL